MEANNRYNRWYAGLGVLALGALALSLTLHDAAAEDDVVLKNPLFSTRAAPIHGGVQVSPGAPQPMSGKMQVLPSVKVDYRTSGPLQEGSGWVKSGFRACALDEECNDCDPCTEDTCQAGTCVNRAYLPGEIAPDCDDDLHCNGLEECVAGECARVRSRRVLPPTCAMRRKTRASPPAFLALWPAMTAGPARRWTPARASARAATTMPSRALYRLTAPADGASTPARTPRSIVV